MQKFRNSLEHKEWSLFISDCWTYLIAKHTENLAKLWSTLLIESFTAPLNRQHRNSHHWKSRVAQPHSRDIHIKIKVKTSPRPAQKLVYVTSEAIFVIHRQLNSPNRHTSIRTRANDDLKLEVYLFASFCLIFRLSANIRKKHNPAVIESTVRKRINIYKCERTFLSNSICITVFEKISETRRE